MPTTRPRHQVTETDDVARALDRAAQIWPGEPRSRLLVRLVELGATSVEREEAEASRRAAVTASSGMLTGLFGESYLEHLRADWPA